jgi:hypothetical protein
MLLDGVPPNGPTPRSPWREEQGAASAQGLEAIRSVIDDAKGANFKAMLALIFLLEQ